jgi:ketosteroid isomerase-like protein
MNIDLAELTELNHDYVASVQNSDVKRFNEILAADFYCSNPDKSLVDRAAFLQQTAKPVTIKNLRAEDVKIRILGDFAIIHAATSYTTADGQQAHGRYTDCWAKQNGKWLAVSAHVSRSAELSPRRPCESRDPSGAVHPNIATGPDCCPPPFAIPRHR